MTIGLAWDWWKERPAKAAAKAKAEAYAEAYAEAQVEFQTQAAEFQTQAAAYRERLLRNGIDPDTGERLPNFSNGANATEDRA
ncbi:MAG: hypothetical protein F4X64_04190 [Chloroflexi bacterium]|nr:hypothetical protein [Chloroflexota bacterium]